ncbi:MAG: site-2 protease family protein [Opitutaceae bacterium]|nr:site-2 protease family protein [Opitutaceae bacterium]
MDLGISPDQLRTGLIYFLVLLMSLVLRAWAQAATATRLGDDTPELNGRVTLNPLPHIDPVGSVIFPLVCIFVFPGTILFGWARPVPINPTNFMPHLRRGEVLTALAGPASSLGLALLAATGGGLLYHLAPRSAELAGTMISLNVALAVFNLLPLPPLDGGQVLRHAVGMREETFHAISRWSMFILLFALWLPPVRTALTVLIQITALPFVLIFQMLAG